MYRRFKGVFKKSDEVIPLQGVNVVVLLIAIP